MFDILYLCSHIPFFYMKQMFGYAKALLPRAVQERAAAGLRQPADRRAESGGVTGAPDYPSL